MPQVCSICKHPERNEIETAIIEREAFRNIAKRFGTSPTVVFRHANDHLPAALTAAKKAEEVTQADSLLERIESLILDVRRIAQKAEKAGQWGQAAAALREARANLELLARLRGELQAASLNVAVAVQMDDIAERLVAGRKRVLEMRQREDEAKAVEERARLSAIPAPSA